MKEIQLLFTSKEEREDFLATLLQEPAVLVYWYRGSEVSVRVNPVELGSGGILFCEGTLIRRVRDSKIAVMSTPELLKRFEKKFFPPQGHILVQE